MHTTALANHSRTNGKGTEYEDGEPSCERCTWGWRRKARGLVTVSPTSDPRIVAQRLQSTLPEDIEALTRDEVLSSEIMHWVWETNYGLIFQSGVLVAVIVGMAIVYQVLASEVASRMPEYATLKAMGYDNAYLVRVMVEAPTNEQAEQAVARLCEAVATALGTANP